MEIKELKTKLWNECRSVLLESVENLKTMVDENQQTANEYGAPKDRYDSFRTQLLRKRDMFAKQLQTAYDQLDSLNRINLEKTIEKVEFGALVITNKQRLFISVGLGKINIEGEDYYAISPGVPIFEALRGMQAGDSCQFNGMEIEILSIN